MGRLGEILRRLLPARPARSEAEAERLRIAFRARYHSFRLLLDANRKALETMAEIEQALERARPFGMTFVRSRCTTIATRVWQMVRRLGELAPGKYDVLEERFREIQASILELIELERGTAATDLVLPLERISAEDAGRVGGKMANLGEMRNRLGLNVPAGFAVTAAGYFRFMEHNDLQTEIARRLQVAEGDDPEKLYQASSEIRQLIIGAPLPLDLQETLLEQYRELEQTCGEDVAVAVRSSALDEDTEGATAAGQYRSELNVSRDSLLDAYREVIASKYAPAAMLYRLLRGLPDEHVAMCVAVLRMIDAAAGGVLYSRSPIDPGNDRVIIDSAWGLPMPVVEGRVAVDHFEVSRGDPPRIRERVIPEKATRFVCRTGEGIRQEENSDAERSAPSLTDDQVLELTGLGVRLEEHYGSPQDVEWALSPQGSIVMLQSRSLRLPEQSTAAEDVVQQAAGKVLLQGGVTASRGAAAGPVFVLEKDADALRFPRGAVMVTVQPLPRWASLLDRASAIVAEHGSVAGHLASVAREFRVPALFGVPHAVSLLPPGRTVTVDAGRRVVFDERIETLLASTEPATNPMEGSPVHLALKGAAERITPLNLLDPDASDFRAESCRTLHDLTRFCHEMAVQEVFRFGKDHRFPERSGKQLYCEVPMQWWVLNLDDGFREEVQGRYVRLENIASVPMLALWEGITGIPWEGPPPMDGKGFMSVMFGATTNTALTTGVASRYADRNYFMISRDYCSLQSRLGAHFAIVEALVSERTPDNFVSFQFKGGAADFERRLRRVKFIGEIVERYGFRVELNEDNLIARIEGREEVFMTSRLKVLGYLAIHTRQLDMVMSRPASVEHYRKKFHRDIASMLHGES